MATLDELSNALVNADKAGDTEAARVLAGEIQKIKAAPSVGEDIAKSAGIGAVKGGIQFLGTPGDVSTLLNKGIDYGLSKFGIAPAAPQYNNPLGSAAIQRGVEGITGQFYQPQTSYGKVAQGVTENVANPLSYIGPGGVAVKAGLAGLTGAGSELGRQAAEGTALETPAAIGGALVAGLLPGGIRRTITPIPSTAGRQGMVEALQKEGVNSLTAGQKTGDTALQYAESILGDSVGAGQKATNIQQEGQKQFTQAAARRAGIETATPEALATNQARLGKQYEDLSTRNTLAMDPQFSNDLLAAVKTYEKVPASQQKAIVENYFGDILNKAPSMSGVDYQEMRSRLSRQANSLRNSDPTLSSTLKDMRDALDSAMERSISPADAALWQQTKQQYAAQKVLEKSAARAGTSTEGDVSPSGLRGVVAGENKNQYARGQGQFAELAHAGSKVMAPLPNSGTGQRWAIHSLASLLGAGGAAGAMYHGVPPEVALTALSAAASPAIMGRALMSAPAQAYLGNQVFKFSPETNSQLKMSRRIAALLAAQRAATH